MLPMVGLKGLGLDPQASTPSVGVIVEASLFSYIIGQFRHFLSRFEAQNSKKSGFSPNAARHAVRGDNRADSTHRSAVKGTAYGLPSLVRCRSEVGKILETLFLAGFF
jgi:hypothetical protein